MENSSGQWMQSRPSGWLKLCRLLLFVAWCMPVFMLTHGNEAQAQAACTQFPVLNHPTYQAFRTNSQTGACTLPSGIVMTWSHVGANRGLTSFGCPSYDPTYWMDGGTMTVTFSQPVNDVGFIIWGLDGTDSAAVTVDAAPPQTLAREFVDLCTGVPGGANAPVVVGNLVQGTGGGYFGQVGVRASSATPYTALRLAIVGSGGGFGLVGVGSPVAIGPGGPPVGANIPTLSEWGLIIMASLMALAGMWFARRRRM